MSSSIVLPKMNVKKFHLEKGKRSFNFLTGYEFWLSTLLEEINIDGILIGDSLAQIIQGRTSTLPVTIDEIIYHAKAVRRGAPKSFIIADMPFMSTQISVEDTLRNCGKVMKEAEVNAVKLEGHEPDKIMALTKAGIPVVAHLGLTPQYINVLGNYSQQAKKDLEAELLKKSCLELDQAGAFAIVLECVPEITAKQITETVKAITIGIGAGPSTDGQILVTHDLLGLSSQSVPKFVRPTLNGRNLIQEALQKYIDRSNSELSQNQPTRASHDLSN